MGSQLDLDDVAVTSDLAMQELLEMRAEIARLRAEVEDAKGETAWLRNRINEIQRKTELDLVNIYDALESASLDDTITDTIWMLHKVSASQTLFDYIDAAIDAARGKDNG